MYQTEEIQVRKTCRLAVAEMSIQMPSGKEEAWTLFRSVLIY